MIQIVHLLLGRANLDSMNGVNHAVHQLAGAQSRAGFPVDVWALSGTRAQANSHPARDYALRIFPRTRARFALSGALRTALDALRPPTWVQLHSVFIPEFLSIARRLRSRGLPYGVSPHGGYSPAALQRNAIRKAVYLTLLERRLIRGAALIHALTEAEAADVQRLAPLTPSAVVPNGVLLAGESWAVAPVPERPLFAFCGRLDQKHKGLDLLIDGFSQYRAGGGTGALWLIGDGRDRAQLERRAQRAGSTSAVRFLGASYGDEKARVLTAIDVFIHTSRWEGLPMSCLEAAAMGKPLLLSRQTNLGDSVEQSGAGWVLPENTPAAIAAGLWHCEHLQREGRLEVAGARARAMVEKSFSWNSAARELIGFWLRHTKGSLSEMPS